MRTNVPPEQLVSFEADTSFDEFVEIVNPIFEREEGKEIVDPEDRTMEIGVPIRGMHYFDAFESVLATQGLTYRETETVFLVQERGEEEQVETDLAVGEEGDPLATLGTREIRIDAVLFNLNLTRVRDLGLSWSEFLGGRGGEGGAGGSVGGGAGGGTTGGDTGGGTGGGDDFFLRTEDLFEPVDDVIEAPDRVSFGQLRRFLNVLEQDNVGQTVANPQVTVQSGEVGEIQIGQDVPVQTTDFAGNTVTQFFETGIIIDVLPTLITETAEEIPGEPELDFIHMDVRVEDSNAQPTPDGPVINRNQADTQVLLLDGEATAIGGLTSTEEIETRSGVPILKDLPGWFFGLRYIFGTERTTVQEQELLIVLQAEVVDPLWVREGQPDEELLDQRREQARETIRQLGERYEEEFPEADNPGNPESGDNPDGGADPNADETHEEDTSNGDTSD